MAHAEAGVTTGVTTWCDRTLDGVVVVLATWTVVYHASLLLGLDAVTAGWAELVLLLAALAGAVVAARRSARTGAPPEPEPESTAAPPAPRGATPHLGAITLGAATVAALAMAAGAPWPLVWVPWLVAAGAGTWWAARMLAHPPAAARADRGTSAVVLAWAVGFAVLAMCALRPNPDDLYYVNLSQWVAEHGTFPLRDTIFANLTYPMTNWPPVASYDALVGLIAHLAHVRAGSVEYFWVPPLAAALSVLALARLLRAWRVRQVAAVLSVALVFLLADGGDSYGTPGNLFVTRLWQGKVILLCLLVPTLLTYALRYVDRPTVAGGVRLFLGSAAALALSTTAIFLTPLLALAGMAPLARRSPRHAAAGFTAMAAYPLAAAVATKLVGGHSADDFGARRLYRFDAAWIGHEIFLTGPIAAVAVLAVLAGTRLVPHPAARVTTGILALATGLVLVPGLTRIAYDATGLGPTLWRISWGCTVAALVGLLALRVAARWKHRWSPVVAVVTSAALLVGLGSPIWAADTGTGWAVPFHWQRTDQSREMADRVIAASRPGDVVLAPEDLAVTITVSTTAVKTVAPRDYYMRYLRGERSFHYRARLALVDFVNHNGPWQAAQVAHAARVVGVDMACLYRPDAARIRAVRDAGFTTQITTSYYVCMKGR